MRASRTVAQPATQSGNDATATARRTHPTAHVPLPILLFSSMRRSARQGPLSPTCELAFIIMNLDSFVNAEIDQDSAVEGDSQRNKGSGVRGSGIAS
jgi:hypothetical protein